MLHTLQYHCFDLLINIINTYCMNMYERERLLTLHSDVDRAPEWARLTHVCPCIRLLQTVDDQARLSQGGALHADTIKCWSEEN